MEAPYNSPISPLASSFIGKRPRQDSLTNHSSDKVRSLTQSIVGGNQKSDLPVHTLKKPKIEEGNKLPKSVRDNFDQIPIVSLIQFDQEYSLPQDLKQRLYEKANAEAKVFLTFSDYWNLKSVPKKIKMISPYVTELDLTYSAVKDLKCLEIFYNLKTLKLPKGTSEKKFANLPNLKELEYLGLKSSNVTDSSISVLRRLPKLRRIELRATNITEVGLKELTSFDNIEELALELKEDGIGSNSLAHLLNLPNLIKLKLRSKGVGLTDNDLTCLAHLKLKTLKLQLQEDEDLRLDFLGSLTTLEHLYIRQPNDENLKQISNLKNLRTLRFKDGSVSNEGVKNLENLHLLNSLNLSGLEKISSLGFSYLVNLTNLEYLNVSGTAIKDEDFIFFKNYNLHSFDVSETEITGAGFQHIRDQKNLHNLSLNYSKTITNENLVFLLSFENLQKLTAHSTDINNTGLKYIACLNSIKFLELSFTNIDGIGREFSNIAALSNLQTLFINGTNLHDEGLTKLVPLENLQTLHINRTKITDKSIILLANFNLNMLQLNKDEISQYSIQYLKVCNPICNVKI